MDGDGVLVSGSYFPTLGVRPALGRLLGPDDDRTVGDGFVAVAEPRLLDDAPRRATRRSSAGASS